MWVDKDGKGPGTHTQKNQSSCYHIEVKALGRWQRRDTATHSSYNISVSCEVLRFARYNQTFHSKYGVLKKVAYVTQFKWHNTYITTWIVNKKTCIITPGSGHVPLCLFFSERFALLVCDGSELFKSKHAHARYRVEFWLMDQQVLDIAMMHFLLFNILFCTIAFAYFFKEGKTRSAAFCCHIAVTVFVCFFNWKRKSDGIIPKIWKRKYIILAYVYFLCEKKSTLANVVWLRKGWIRIKFGEWCMVHWFVCRIYPVNVLQRWWKEPFSRHLTFAVTLTCLDKF